MLVEYHATVSGLSLSSLRAQGHELNVQDFLVCVAELLPQGYTATILARRGSFTVQLFDGVEEVCEFPTAAIGKMWNLMIDVVECARGIEAVKIAMARGEL